MVNKLLLQHMFTFQLQNYITKEYRPLVIPMLHNKLRRYFNDEIFSEDQQQIFKETVMKRACIVHSQRLYDALLKIVRENQCIR